MSVGLKTVPQLVAFRKFDLASPILEFFVSELTAVSMKGDSLLRKSFKDLFLIVWVPSIFFLNLLLISLPSCMYWRGVNVFCFSNIPLGFGQISCSFKTSTLLFKSHHADFDIGRHCLTSHFPFSWNLFSHRQIFNKHLSFVSSTYIAITLTGLNVFSRFSVNSFTYVLTYRIKIMFTSNAISLPLFSIHLLTEILNMQDETLVQNF